MARKKKKKKEVAAVIKLQCPGGQATPAPPIGPALGQHGVPIGQFIEKFNSATADADGMTIPVVITVYADRTFDFELKSPPAAVLLKRAAGIAQGAVDPGKGEIVGRVTMEQIREIAKTKMVDLNAYNDEAAVRQIAGTARSMGIGIEGEGDS